MLPKKNLQSKKKTYEALLEARDELSPSCPLVRNDQRKDVDQRQNVTSRRARDVKLQYLESQFHAPSLVVGQAGYLKRQQHMADDCSSPFPGYCTGYVDEPIEHAKRLSL